MHKMHGETNRVRFERDGTVVAEGTRPSPEAPDGLVVHGVHYDLLSYQLITDDHGPMRGFKIIASLRVIAAGW